MKWRGNKSLLRKKTLSIFCFLVLEPQHITFLLNLAVMYSCQLNWMSFEWSGLSEKEIETCVHLGIFPYLGSYMIEIEKNIYIMMKDDLASWQVYLPHQCPVPVSRLSFHKRLYFAIFAIFLYKYICKIFMTLLFGSRNYSRAHSSLIIAIGKFAELSHSHIISGHMPVTYLLMLQVYMYTSYYYYPHIKLLKI